MSATPYVGARPWTTSSSSRSTATMARMSSRVRAAASSTPSIASAAAPGSVRARTLAALACSRMPGHVVRDGVVEVAGQLLALPDPDLLARPHLGQCPEPHQRTEGDREHQRPDPEEHRGAAGVVERLSSQVRHRAGSSCPPPHPVHWPSDPTSRPAAARRR